LTKIVEVEKCACHDAPEHSNNPNETKKIEK
jgi:hypothetical protein